MKFSFIYSIICMIVILSCSLKITSNETSTMYFDQKDTMDQQSMNMIIRMITFRSNENSSNSSVLNKETILLSFRKTDDLSEQTSENIQHTFLHLIIQSLLNRIDSTQKFDQTSEKRNTTEDQIEQMIIVAFIILSGLVISLMIILIFHRARRNIRNKFHITRVDSLLLNDKKNYEETIKLLS
ncbi:hypothetical protein I4U23_021236 [Adineta vaga]|nr:hypothetical protein I4U23_021236 [Adineta vaga]